MKTTRSPCACLIERRLNGWQVGGRVFVSVHHRVDPGLAVGWYRGDGLVVVIGRRHINVRIR